jgi:hypothetical protein
MVNEKYRVFRIISCISLHDGRISVVLQKMTNSYDFDQTETIEKILEPSFGAIIYGDFFCMAKINGIWEFAE